MKIIRCSKAVNLILAFVLTTIVQGCRPGTEEQAEKAVWKEFPHITTMEELRRLLNEHERTKNDVFKSSTAQYWSREIWERIRHVAMDPATPTEFLTEIMRRFYRDESFAQSAAAHRNATPELLNWLADHPCESVYSAVASNRNTTAETLRKIYFNPKTNFYVRGIAAGMPQAPPEIITAFLTEAVRSDSAEKRRWAAEFGGAPAEVYSKLSKDPDKHVRNALAQNLSAPMSVLESLAKDFDPYVNRKAINTIRKLKEARFAKKAMDFIRSNQTVVNFLGSVPEIELMPADSTEIKSRTDGGVNGEFRFRIKAAKIYNGSTLSIRWRSKDFDDDFQPLQIWENGIPTHEIWKADGP